MPVRACMHEAILGIEEAEVESRRRREKGHLLRKGKEKGPEIQGRERLEGPLHIQRTSWERRLLQGEKGKRRIREEICGEESGPEMFLNPEANHRVCGAATIPAHR